jgi:hypothetical protein
MPGSSSWMLYSSQGVKGLDDDDDDDETVYLHSPKRKWNRKQFPVL